MKTEQYRHRGSATPEPQGQTAGANEEQQGDESEVHWFLCQITVQGVPATMQPPQASRADHQCHASYGAKQLGQARKVIRRLPTKRIVIHRCEARCRKTKHKAVKSEVVVAPARQGEGVIFVVAPFAVSAVQI